MHAACLSLLHCLMLCIWLSMQVTPPYGKHVLDRDHHSPAGSLASGTIVRFADEKQLTYSRHINNGLFPASIPYGNVIRMVLLI